MLFLQHLLTGWLVLLALGWLGLACDYFRGSFLSRRLDEAPPFEENTLDAPSVSVIVAACNEADKIAPAFRTLLAQTYPGPFQIIAVDDRSTDQTPALLDTLAAEAGPDKDVTVLHLTQLPPGWLGKNHALYRGAECATGRYLLFTDADVFFSPDAISRAVRLAERDQVHHVVSFFQLILHGFWENVFGLSFGTFFFLRFRPWRVRNPKTKNYLGIGGFNLVRRDAYEAVGTHRAIALEVADDMELGRLLKFGGFRSEVVGAENFVRVRWQEGGLVGLMNGLTKNAYAGLNYSPVTLAGSVGLLLATVVYPVFGLLFAPGVPARIACVVSVLCLVAIGAHHARKGRIPSGYALTLPLSCLLLIVVMCRSAFITTRSGGITWRGTFYPLGLLKARPIPPLPPPL